MAKKNIRAGSDEARQERTERALHSAARWLKRRGAAREGRTTQRAYNDASRMINRIARDI